MSKTLLEKMEEANRRPVPYEGLKLYSDGISGPVPEGSEQTAVVDRPPRKEAPTSGGVSARKR